MINIFYLKISIYLNRHFSNRKLFFPFGELVLKTLQITLFFTSFSRLFEQQIHLNFSSLATIRAKDGNTYSLLNYLSFVIAPS